MNPDYRNFVPYKYFEWLIGARHYVMNYDLDDKKSALIEEALLSAVNLINFLGDAKYANAENTAKNIRFFQMVAATDQHYPFLLERLKLTNFGLVKNLIEGDSPCIYCTYHIGSYRMINQFLISKKVPYSLVVDQNFVDNQGDKSLKILRNLQHEINGEKYFEPELLNAEDRRTGIEIIKRIRAGRSILFYIDGNTGVNTFHNSPSKMIVVPFFNHDIFARKGVSFFSYKTQVPIIPVFALRNDWFSNEIIFESPILPDSGCEIEQYCKETTLKLFKILEGAIKKYPDQWEGWYYVHKFLCNKSEFNSDTIEVSKKINETVVFNPDYDLVKLASKYYLYNKHEEEATEITETFSNILNYIKAGNHCSLEDTSIYNILVKKEAFLELIEKGILVKN